MKNIHNVIFSTKREKKSKSFSHGEGDLYGFPNRNIEEFITVLFRNHFQRP